MKSAHGYGKVGRAMASGLVRSALSNILTDSTFTGIYERSKVSCEQVIALHDKVAEDRYCDMF